MASSILIERSGWQAAFYVGGILPLLVSILLIFLLPESTVFLVTRGGSTEKIRSIVRRIGSHAASQATRFVVGEQESRGVSLRQLFAHGQTTRTLYLWMLCFMAWMALIVVSFWTPALIQNVGFTASAAAVTLLFNNSGAVIGTILIGSLMQRFGNFRVLVLSFFASAWAVAALGMLTSALSYVLVSSALAGFFLSASCAGLIAIAASTYPPSARSTGIGWAIGIGRLGSIAGPVLAGHLLALNWSVRDIYLALSVPCVCASVLVLLLGHNASRSATFARTRSGSSPRSSINRTRW